MHIIVNAMKKQQPTKADIISEHMRKLGQKGGTARAKNPKNSGKLSEWARKAANARWSRNKPKKGKVSK